MQGSFQVVLNSVVTLFLMMAVGFTFARKKLFSEQTIAQMSHFLLYVVTPCIVVDLFLVERSPETDRKLLSSGGALLFTYGVYVLLSFLLFRRQPEQDRGLLRFGSVYGNIGFMGLPLIQAALGDEAAMTAAVGLGVFNVVAWTHGYAAVGGRKNLSLKKAVLNPAVPSFAAAVVLYLTGLRFPAPVSAAVSFLAALNTPLAMVVIGAQMAKSSLLSVFRDKRPYIVCFVKLVAMPLLTMVLLLPLRLDATTYTALVILSGCPTAGVTSLFSQMLDRDTALAARTITLSTLLCILTLPLAALLAQMIYG